MKKKETKIASVNERYDQTPIEIALEIDNNGMTTAKKLYEFLELDPHHYARWYKRNILDNKFADEHTDYMVFAQSGEKSTNGRPTQDYKLTADFAKKLCMTGNTLKHEQAKQYFIACEKGLKIATAKLKQNSTDFTPLVDAVNQFANIVTSMQQDIQDIKNQTSQKQLPKKRFNPWISRMLPKYRLLENHLDITRKELYKNLFLELKNTYSINLDQFVDDYCYENNLENCYTMEVIENTKELRDMLELLINSLLEKYNLLTHDEIENKRVKTIFDDDITHDKSSEEDENNWI